MNEAQLQQMLAEVATARDLLGRIDAMVCAPYWTSERRDKIGEAARKATKHLATAEALCRATTS